MKPYAMTNMSQGTSRAMVSAAITTTPAATERATLALMGCGNEKNGFRVSVAMYFSV